MCDAFSVQASWQLFDDWFACASYGDLVGIVVLSNMPSYLVVILFLFSPYIDVTSNPAIARGA